MSTTTTNQFKSVKINWMSVPYLPPHNTVIKKPVNGGDQIQTLILKRKKHAKPGCYRLDWYCLHSKALIETYYVREQA